MNAGQSTWIFWMFLSETNNDFTKITINVHSFIHSFRLFLAHLFKSTTTQRCSRHSTDTVPEFHTEAPQATASEGLSMFKHKHTQLTSHLCCPHNENVTTS